MAAARLLLVEDDPRIVSFLQPGLRAENYSVDVARDGNQGLELARRGDFALIILDYMLPGLSGLDVCSRLRQENCPSLILMLTARHGVQDKIAGLRGGADDYLTKPFIFEELLARIEALLRRGKEVERTPPVMTVGDLTLDGAAKSLRRGERLIELTPREFALVSYLMANAGTVVSRTMLLANVWGLSFDPGTKVVDVYIRYLRRKVDAEGEPELIHTVRGFGYMISAEKD